MNKTLQNDLFIRAAFGQQTERPPVWMMRQAGRYMPEYWEIKNKYTFLEMCKTPEIAADVTMLPVDLLDIDAAILFSDILVTPEAMGGDLSFEQGVGPRFSNPVRNWEDAEKLNAQSADRLQYVADAIKVIQERLNGSIPLIGFAGAPFTILSYLVEGKSSRDFKLTKTLLNNDPKLAHYILQKITDLTVDYLNMQIAAGVNAVQLFDSWAMALTWNDYIEFGHAYTQQIISRINRESIPVISFARGSSVFYPIMSEAKPDVISLDWNADILNVKNNLPKEIAVQGNFDPIILYADKPVIRKKIHELFERMRGQDGFLFNLGHGIMPDMPFDHVKYTVDVIKEFRY
ncbi:uroporphyrinogen decarboxylase [Sphingobacterium spiritivorum]|uniref:Uroporphyrinogen decarboxylase n=1 Tax=Sphingobacterium spiritivorum ATCC 33861 TaxID=525373 RepID=D7VN07_SPHSI|nr:uroporphyrinogen decarboxylase [Sphingobacterium spiritivorum]EFK57304.1 uroporphyrinogen decarboxylase [Sphingobacterium spiritivorum ATCC 33861]QQT36613.1 uroporphyrinogen decarboxylase [Sphingobacterium spiritivorum]WQD33365.1 uroporphyrinogen decarboxylase [Sphingobacterium spiritivorum]SUJ22789.1 Uroporphyrinogen decarboxylase [Sphingobacterium spiritivorum]